MEHKVVEEFKTLCCDHPRKVGEILKIVKQTSPNRLLIEGEVGYHKVKRSTFYRCTIEI